MLPFHTLRPARHRDRAGRGNGGGVAERQGDGHPAHASVSTAGAALGSGALRRHRAVPKIPSMRATCPSCEAVYEIPDRLIGSGRRLRCANCGHEWALQAPAAEPQATSPEAPPAEPARPQPPSPRMVITPPPPPAFGPPEPPQAAPAASEQPLGHPMLRRAPQVIDPPLPAMDDNTGRPVRADLALRAAWAGSVLLVLLALVGLWAFRYEIAMAWPPAARLVGTPTSGG